MEWGYLLVLVIPLVVWVLSNLFRPQEEEQRDARRRTGRGQGQGRQRPTSDVERFLEEINRRRREAARQPEPVIPVVVAVEPEPPRRRPDQPVPSRPPRRKLGRRTPEVLQVVVAEETSRAPGDLPAVAMVDVGLTPAPPPPTSARPMPTAFRQVRTLLGSPQSLRAAFMLQEILGPPKCRK